MLLAIFRLNVHYAASQRCNEGMVTEYGKQRVLHFMGSQVTAHNKTKSDALDHEYPSMHKCSNYVE